VTVAYRARRSQRAAESGTNTGPHKTLRKRLLAQLARSPGQPCARCGLPMWPSQRLDLDHTDDRSGYLGLSHATCNRRAGQAKTAAINRARGRQLTPAQLAAIRFKQWQAAAARRLLTVTMLDLHTAR
jgi:hypothetical protein